MLGFTPFTKALKTFKPKFKTFIYFKNISFKAVLGVSNKVLNKAKYIFTFGAY